MIFPYNDYNYCEVGHCSRTKWDCFGAINVTEEDCPNKCEGLIVGVRKDPVRRLHKVQTSVLRVSVIKTFVLLRISVLIKIPRTEVCKEGLAKSDPGVRRLQVRKMLRSAF